jgi:site-specific DNA-cytosine methylase
VGRAAAIAAAVVAGIVSLPALLGSDRPPPVPPDVGLAAPPATDPVAADPARVEPPTAAAPKDRPGRHRAARRHPESHLVRTHQSGGKRSRQSHRGRQHEAQPVAEAPPPHPAPTYVPAPVYSPPPQPGEFLFER